MSKLSIFKKIFNKKLIVLLALMGAATAAFFKNNALAYIGIAYYIICAIAVFRNHPKAGLLLWGAVTVHLMLTIYMLWDLAVSGTIPCRYCMTAAGCALFAAVTWWKKDLAFIPVILITVVWYFWPLIFYDTPRSLFNGNGNITIVNPSTKDTDCGC